MWDASLNNSTEEVPFKLEIKDDKGNLSAAVWNGPEPMPFTSAKFEEGTLTLRFEQYDGTLTAKLQNGKLIGEYSRPYAKQVIHYAFTAVYLGLNVESGYFKYQDKLPFNGEWIYKLQNQQGKTAESGVAEFNSDRKYLSKPTLTGILIPVSGDTGLLAGQ